MFVRLPGPLTTSFAVDACEKAGLVNLRFYDTLHTFATRLRANGVHEWDIRDLLGHASVRMTSVYTHQTPANLCKAVSTLGQTKLGKVVSSKRKSQSLHPPNRTIVRLNSYQSIKRRCKPKNPRII